MKNAVKSIFVVMIATLIWTGTASAQVGEDDVVGLVEQAADALTKDSPTTIDSIIKGEHPFKNKDNKSLYVFVYDTDVTMIAHPKSVLVGKSYKGKPDVRGKKFRDDIVAGALTDGTGWVKYAYTKPGEKGIHNKKTYFQLVEGSDGAKYVVCAGMYDK